MYSPIKGLWALSVLNRNNIFGPVSWFVMLSRVKHSVTKFIRRVKTVVVLIVVIGDIINELVEA